MGRVRTTSIKRAAFELLQAHSDKFGADFDRNKRVLSELMPGLSKTERNRLAGYITSLWKRQNAAQNRPE